jgi:hypothetical protein
VDIETVSPLAAGQTVCDIWQQSSAPKNCRCGLVAALAGTVCLPFDTAWRGLIAHMHSRLTCVQRSIVCCLAAGAVLHQGWQCHASYSRLLALQQQTGLSTANAALLT